MNRHQLTLGELIALLVREPRDQDRTVRFDFVGAIPRDIDSYRGYYDHLAIGWDRDYSKRRDVAGLLADLRDCIGRTFQGYKGGYFTMRESTPMWVANWGECDQHVITGVRDLGWMTLIETANEASL